MIAESEMLYDFFVCFCKCLFDFSPSLKVFVGSFSRITNSGFQERFMARLHELLCHENSEQQGIVSLLTVLKV